jgi:hypothetical protein
MLWVFYCIASGSCGNDSQFGEGNGTYRHDTDNVFGDRFCRYIIMLILEQREMKSCCVSWLGRYGFSQCGLVLVCLTGINSLTPTISWSRDSGIFAADVFCSNARLWSWV